MTLLLIVLLILLFVGGPYAYGGPERGGVYAGGGLGLVLLILLILVLTGTIRL